MTFERWPSTSAVAWMLCSSSTVYKLCARGELGHVRVLNLIRIPEGALR